MTSKRTPGPHRMDCPPLTDWTIFRVVNKTAIKVQQIRTGRHPTPCLPNDASSFIPSTNLLPWAALTTDRHNHRLDGYSNLTLQFNHNSVKAGINMGEAVALMGQQGQN